MTAIAFIDANIVVYASGAGHRYRDPCRLVLQWGGSAGPFVSSAEVMQELLNLGIRRDDLQGANAMLRALTRACASIEAIMADDVLAAARIDLPRLSARDRIHLAVMQRLNCTHIVTTDRAFEAVSGVTRLDPLEFERWREDLAGD